MGAGLAASSRLTAIIIPSLTDTADPVTTRCPSLAEAHEALTASCFTPAAEFWRPWLVTRARPDADLAAGGACRCSQLAASLPCVTISSGTRGPLDDYAEALAVVSRLILRPSILGLLIPRAEARGEVDLGITVGERACQADIQVHRVAAHWVTLGDPCRYYDALTRYWSTRRHNPRETAR